MSEDSEETVMLTLDEYNKWRIDRDITPLPPVSEKRQRSIYVSNIAYENLQKLAVSHNYAHYKAGNVSLLMEAIGYGIYTLVLTEDIDSISSEIEESKGRPRPTMQH